MIAENRVSQIETMLAADWESESLRRAVSDAFEQVGALQCVETNKWRSE